MNKGEIQKLLDMEEAQLEELILSKYVAAVYSVTEANFTENLQDRSRKAKGDIEQKLTQFEAKLKKAICQDLNYCEAINGTEWEFIQMLVDAGIFIALQIPLPTGHIAAYLLRLGYLDRLCECPKKITSSINDVDSTGN